MMPDKESPSARYRRLAQECLETARTVTTEETRATLVEMARAWLRLAEQQEVAAPPHSPSEQSRPAVQQQQQVQPKDDDKKD